MIKFLIKILLVILVGTFFTLLPNYKNSLVYAALRETPCTPDAGYQYCFSGVDKNTTNKIQIANSESRNELRDCRINGVTEKCVVGSYKYYTKCSGGIGCGQAAYKNVEPSTALTCGTGGDTCSAGDSEKAVCPGVTLFHSDEGTKVINAPTNILPPIQFTCSTHDYESATTMWWTSTVWGYSSSTIRQAPNYGFCTNGKCTTDNGATFYDPNPDGTCSNNGTKRYDSNPDGSCSNNGVFRPYDNKLTRPIYVVRCINNNDCSNLANHYCDISGNWDTWACKPDPNNPPIRAFVTDNAYTGNLKNEGNAGDGVTGADNLCQSAANSSTTYTDLRNSRWRAWVSAENTGAQNNLVQNSNFENGQLNPWECVTSAGSCEITAPPPGNSSAKAAKVYRTTTDAYISQNISASPGDSLCLSFKMYGATTAIMYGQLYNGDAVTGNFNIPGNASWQTIEKNISIPKEWRSGLPIYLHLYAFNNGATIYLDDISVTKCSNNAKDRIQNGVYSNLNYQTIGTSIGNLIQSFSPLLKPINITETGSIFNSPFLEKVWTGTNTDGFMVSDYTCSNWTKSTSNYNGVFGSSAYTTGEWTNFGNKSCQGYNHLYCFEEMYPRISIQSVNGVTTPPWNVTIASPEVIFNTNMNANCRYSTVDESYDQMGPGKNLSEGQGSTSHKFTPTLLLGNNNLHIACKDLTSQQASNSSGNNYDLAINYNPTPCSGTIALSFTRTGASVTTTSSGLSNCNGKTVTFKTGNSCTPPNGVDFTPANTCSVVSSGCSGRAFNAPATNTEYSACIDQNGDSDYNDQGEYATATLQITSTTQSGSCTGGSNRADGLVSAPEITGKFNTSGGCAIDPKAAFVPFKIPTFDSLKSIYFDQSKLPRTGDNQQLFNISNPPIELGGNRDRVYFINGDLTIDDPDDIRGNQTGLIFVNGKLNISGDKLEHGNATSGLVFVVKGNVIIDKDIREINAVIIAEGIIYTAGENCPVNTILATNPLIVNGSFISINQNSSSNPPIRFCRNLSNNDASPAEIINHQIKYLPILKDLFSDTYQKWSEIP